MYIVILVVFTLGWQVNDSWFDPSRRRISVKHVGLPAVVSLCEQLKVGSTCIKLNNVLHMNLLSSLYLFQKREGILQSRQIQEEITGNTE